MKNHFMFEKQIFSHQLLTFMPSQQTHPIGQNIPSAVFEDAPDECATVAESTNPDEAQAIGDTQPYPVFAEFPSTYEDPFFVKNSTSFEVDQSAFPSHSYQLIVVGRNNSQDRESVLVRLDEGLLNRLSKFASGSRSTLIELALSHMVDALEAAQLAGEPVLVVEAMEVQKRLFGEFP